MTKRKQTALEALGAFEREQQERAKREGELRRGAALELGFVVLEEGGARLGIDALRSVVKAAVAALSASDEAVQRKGHSHG